MSITETHWTPPRQALALGINISIHQGDITSYQCDVLVLKYAQDLYGVDAAVVERLKESGVEVFSRLPAVSHHSIIDSGGTLSANHVLFVGVEELFRFSYRQVREFARRALYALASGAPNALHIATTLQGAGFGLDEGEAFDSEVAGFIDAISAGQYPRALRNITIVERDVGRAGRLEAYLTRLLPDKMISAPSSPNSYNLPQGASERLGSVGYDSQNKPHVFVAMPFSEDMEDVYHYGIQGAVKAAGFLCERADLAAFTGDVMAWVKHRIESASLVIADLTGANPNVYLEVGYAWGCDRPTVLLARDIDELKFDTKGQRCIKYNKIRELEKLLGDELKNLKQVMRPGLQGRVGPTD